MASHSIEMSLEPLKPLLFDEEDDAEDLQWKAIINSLILGEQSPAEAATAFDNWVVTRSESLWEVYSKWREIQHKKDDPDDFDQSQAPRPPLISSLVDYVFDTFARLFISYPPHQDGQNRLVGFLEALRALPRKKVQDGYGRSISKGEDITLTELWPFENNKWALTENFRRVVDVYFSYGDVGIQGTDPQIGWRNFQSGIARITILGFVDLGFLSSLNWILPSFPSYPNFEERKIRAVNRVSADVIAAHYWINTPEICRHIYEECQKIDQGEDWRQLFSKKSWNIWLKQFKFVLEDERFWPEAKQIAEQALTTMHQVEKENI